MEIRFIIIFLVFIATACHSPRQNQDVKRVKVKIDRIKNKEYIDWDSIKLIGHIPMVSGFNDAIKLLGTPDSIITPNESVGEYYKNQRFRYCYLKGIRFEKYNDSLVFREIDFRKSANEFLLYKQIRFDGEMTLATFEKLFPISAVENGLHGTDMDISQSISVRTAKPGSSIGDNWVFTFENSHNKLIRLEYWIAD